MIELAAALLGIVFLLALVGIGTYMGWDVAHQQLNSRVRQLDEQQSKLQAEWDALHTAQRLQAAFMHARRAMAEEAIRQSRTQGRGHQR